MQNCPSCGSENDQEAVFCEDCGAQISLSPASAVAVATREGHLKPGDVAADRYRIEEVLETGAIHRYRATDLEDDSAVLVLESSLGDGQSATAHQAELLEAVDHASVWKPALTRQKGAFDYLVGPLPGVHRLLDRSEAEGRLSAEQVYVLGHGLNQAVAALHSANLLIRSLRPSRVWLRDDDEVVLDAFDRCTPADQAGNDYAVIPGFSPPEAYGMQGGNVDKRSDLFSLGALLHFALTGDSPDLEARESFFSFPRPDVPGAGRLVDVIMKAVSKRPDNRYATAEELEEALRASLQVAGTATQELPEEELERRVGPLRYRVAMLSDIGAVRSINQDACLELRFRSVERSVPQDTHLIAVIDGMGGEAEGDKAASLALRAMAQEVVGTVLSLQNGRVTCPLFPPDLVGRNRYVLRRALEVANRIIHDYAAHDPARRGMGCTITACMLESDRAVFGHVGDTRALLIRSEIDQITTDHSLVGRLVQMGQLTPEEARTSPQRSIIYRAMGTNREVEIDLYDRKLEPGDYLMMSSDGVWEYFKQGELLAIFEELGEPEQICQRLVQICLDRGADDNATVAIVRAI